MDIKNVPRSETHSHSFYSNIRLLDSINRPKDMILTAYKLGLSGIALTDHEALCGAVEWLELEKELKEKEQIPQDFKCMLGNEIYLTDTRDKGQKYYHFILIAKDTVGFRQLAKLSSQSWYNSYFDRGMERVPTLKTELSAVINENKGHVIASNACIGGQLGQLILALNKAEKKKDDDEIYQCKSEIDKFLKYCLNLFGKDFYIEVAPGLSKDQRIVSKRIKDIAKAYNIKMIFACDAHYLTKKERPVHKAYLNSKEGDREVDDFYAFSHLMDNIEAKENLPDYTDEEFIQMCNHTMEIRNKVGQYDIFHQPIIPYVQVKDYPKTLSYFDYDLVLKKKLINEWTVIKKLLLSDNIQERYWINQCLSSLIDKNLFNEQYLDRINTEADVLSTISEKMNNCMYSYFNTFQHYIDLFWNCGSIVGPGRGSAVGFLSNYLLGITQLDPIKWDLPYWRHLNKDRAELPDIDIDLSPSRRKLIFKRIRDEIGETHLLQVCTFGTEGTRSAISAACRGYRSEEYPEGIDVDIAMYLSSLIPQERGFLWELNDVLYGNEEKERKPVKAFIDEVEKYPGLLDIIASIDGIVCRRGQHASGVILYNVDPWETGAMMKSPSGDLTTQFDLKKTELLGDTKFDFLVTEIVDKLINCISLLQEDGLLEKELSLREVYNKHFHPEVLDYSSPKIWGNLAEGSVMDVFQFNSDVGLSGAMQIKPKTPMEMSLANAMIRLAGEKGKERPLDRYVRFKNDIQQWYNEMSKWHLTQDEIKILEKWYLPRQGCPVSQEDLMLICMDENIAHFSLKEANQARKIVSKKQIKKVPELKEKFISACPSRNFGEYVWETTMLPQMSYSFSMLHALAYTFVGIQTLVMATNYPSIYWNCACLITNSGGDEIIEEEEEIVSIYEEEDFDEYEYEDLPDRSGKKKKKVKTCDYGKISTAIGQMASRGIKVSPPDINMSTFTFKPLREENKIIYGLKGITRIGPDIITQIISNRPYSSIPDFLSKVKLNKPQMINLIKSGAFDNFGDRTELMKSYILSVADQKKRLTLQNMAMLISKQLLPAELSFEIKTFNFNKYLKKAKWENYYLIDDIAYRFYSENFDLDNVFLVKDKRVIEQSVWDKIYKKTMEPVKAYLKEHNTEKLNELNDLLFKDEWDKYCEGTVSKWEMDSVSYYSHPHELNDVDENIYNLENFFDLSEEPVVEKTLWIKGKEVPIYHLSRIVGTILDKDKNKSTITILTTHGVVVVKIYKAQFAKYDRQLSERLADGTKHIIEKSWFKRGNKVLLMGIRRGQNFIPKKYKSTPGSVISLITEIDGKTMKYKTEREEV